MPTLAGLLARSENESNLLCSISPTTANLCLSLLESYCERGFWWTRDESGNLIDDLTDSEWDQADGIRALAIEEMQGGNPVHTAIVGEVRMFAGGVPDRWYVCDGRALLRVDEPALFAEIGTTWGNTTNDDFCLPDSRLASPQGVKVGTEELGTNVGTLLQTSVPEHRHTELSGTGQIYYAGGSTPGRPRFSLSSVTNSVNPEYTGNTGTAGGVDQRGPRFTVYFAIYAGE